MKKFVLMVMAIISGLIVAHFYIKKRTVDNVVDTPGPDYITPEDVESMTNIDIPVQ